MKTALHTKTIAQCLPILELNKGLGVPIVDSDNRLLAILTDGDVRRYLIKGYQLTENCMNAANRDFFSVTEENSISLEHRSLYSFVPVVDAEMRVKKFIVSGETEVADSREVAGLVMAGGVGARMRPLTDSLPKPLISLYGKTLIERILARFSKIGLDKVYISVNYLSEKVISLVGDGSRWGLSIEYLQESEPLGTGGALGLITEPKHQHYIVTNGDVYSRIDFLKLIKFHKNHNGDATMVAVPISHTVPFGVIKHDCGEFLEIIEKPTYDYQCNSGIYVISRDALSRVQKGEFLDLPDLMTRLQSSSRRVNVYETEEYWADIGNISELNRNQRMLETLAESGPE